MLQVEFRLEDHLKNIAENADPLIYYDTIFENTNLRVGVLRLSENEKDTQSPHTEDEIYYCVKGDGFLNIEGKNYLVKPGKIFFVGKGELHQFHGFSQEIVILYFFS